MLPGDKLRLFILRMKHIGIFDSTAAGCRLINAAKQRGYRVTMVSGREQARFASTAQALANAAVVDQLIEVTDLDDFPTILRTVAAEHSQYPFTAILSIFEGTVYSAACVADHLGLIHPPLEAIKKCRNKRLTREALAYASIPSVAFASVSSEIDLLSHAERLGFPLFFKPATGSGSLFAQAVCSPEELLDVFRCFLIRAGQLGKFGGACLTDEVILEEILEGIMVSAEVAASRGKVWVMAIGERKRWSENDSIELGTSIPPKNLSCAEVTACSEYAKRVAEALHLNDGMFHLEIMLTNSGPRLIEANCRIMGGNGAYLLTEALGEEVFDILLDIHEGGEMGDRQDCVSQQAVVSHILASTIDTRVTFKEEDMDFIKDFSENLVSFHFNLRSGQQIKRVRSNFDYVGGFQMRGATIAEAENLVTQFHQRLANSLAIPFAY